MIRSTVKNIQFYHINAYFLKSTKMSMYQEILPFFIRLAIYISLCDCCTWFPELFITNLIHFKNDQKYISVSFLVGNSFHFFIHSVVELKLRTFIKCMISSRTGFIFCCWCCLFYAVFSFNLYGKLWLSIFGSGRKHFVPAKIFREKKIWLSFHRCH